jgi:hypothetical protein
MRQVNLRENRFTLRETRDKRDANKKTNAEILLQGLAPTNDSNGAEPKLQI